MKIRIVLWNFIVLFFVFLMSVPIYAIQNEKNADFQIFNSTEFDADTDRINISNDGKYIFKSRNLYAFPSLKLIHSFQNFRWAKASSFSIDSRFVVILGNDKKENEEANQRIEVYNISENKIINRIEHIDPLKDSIFFSKKNTIIYLNYNGSRIIEWNFIENKVNEYDIPYVLNQNPKLTFEDVILHPNGKYLFALYKRYQYTQGKTEENYYALLIDIDTQVGKTEKIVYEIKINDRKINDTNFSPNTREIDEIMISPDARRLIFIAQNNNSMVCFYIFDLKEEKFIMKKEDIFTWHVNPYVAFISKDSKYMYLWSNGGSYKKSLLTIYELPSFNVIKTYENVEAKRGIVVDNEENYLAYADNNKVTVWAKEEAIQRLCRVVDHDIADYYEGECKNSFAHGKGKARGKNNEYEGDFVAGKKQGYGVYKWADGTTYEGSWEEDARHGWGKFYRKGTSYIDPGFYRETYWYQDIEKKPDPDSETKPATYVEGCELKKGTPINKEEYRVYCNGAFKGYIIGLAHATQVFGKEREIKFKDSDYSSHDEAFKAAVRWLKSYEGYDH